MSMLLNMRRIDIMECVNTDSHWLQLLCVGLKKVFIGLAVELNARFGFRARVPISDRTWHNAKNARAWRQSCASMY
jgi:hypothetical protein